MEGGLGQAQRWSFPARGRGGRGGLQGCGGRGGREQKGWEGRRALPFQKPSHLPTPVPGNKLHIWSHFPGRRKKKASLKIFFLSHLILGLELPSWVTAKKRGCSQGKRVQESDLEQEGGMRKRTECVKETLSPPPRRALGSEQTLRSLR